MGPPRRQSSTIETPKEGHSFVAATQSGILGIWDLRPKMRIFFTTHHNWDWVVLEAFSGHESIRFDKVQGASGLPSSSSSGPKVKARYSLFRLDLVDDSQGKQDVVGRIRIDSPCLEGLDPKDLLVRLLQDAGRADCLPATQLIPWDADESFPIEFPSFPALLKAPLGSGGFGLYFVYEAQDVRQVMACPRHRASTMDPNFMPKLLQAYGSTPLCWSLQQLLHPVECLQRRSQVRAYVVSCAGQLHLYTTYEVRLPRWDIDLAATLQREATALGTDERPQWSEEVENACVGSGRARPYNEQRNKAATERYLLDELDALRGAEPSITACMAAAFQAIQPHLLMTSDDSSSASLAIAGVDLLVTNEGAGGGFRAFIVEVNNNPAMPAQGKHMSARYRQHLRELVQSIADLAASSIQQQVLFGTDPQQRFTVISPSASSL